LGYLEIGKTKIPTFHDFRVVAQWPIRLARWRRNALYAMPIFTFISATCRQFRTKNGRPICRFPVCAQCGRWSLLLYFKY